MFWQWPEDKKGPRTRNASGCTLLCKHCQYSAHKTPPIFCTLHTGQREDRVEASHGDELRSGGQNLQSRRRHFYDYFTGSKRANFAWHDRKNIWCILWSGGTMPPARHWHCSSHIQISITKDSAEEISIKGDSTLLCTRCNRPTQKLSRYLPCTSTQWLKKWRNWDF